MSQLQQITDEEIRDEVFAIFEEHEQELIDLAEKIEKIEEDAKILIERNIIAIKNKMSGDESIPDDKLQQAVLDEIKRVADKITEDVKENLDKLVKEQTEKTS